MLTAFSRANSRPLARLCCWRDEKDLFRVDVSTQEQVNDLANLRDEHAKRLRVLVRQSAQLGRSSPAEILVEIEDIQKEITRITADMAKLQIGASELLQRAVRAGETNNLSDISMQLSNFSATFTHELQFVYELLFSEHNTDAIERKKRQRITMRFYIVISLLVLFDILAHVFIR